MKSLFVPAVLIMLFAFTSGDELTGRWERKMTDGNIMGVIFKPDKSLEWYVNKKPFVSGTYTLENSVFTIEGNGCPGIKGIYKINFFSNSDSLR